MSYKYITHKDSGNFTPASSAKAVFGMSRVIEGITIHHWGDPNHHPQFMNIVDYLCRPGGNTSAHYVVSGTDRQVACIVNPGDVAWHSGSAWGNARTIGVELDPRARPEDYDTAAELIADIRSAFGDVPIYWHSYFTATACPGAWDADRLDKLSYTKYSAAEWGQGGNKNPTTTAPPPPAAPPVPAAPAPMYRLFVGDKQVAAYQSERNAFQGYVNYGSTGAIRLGGTNVTEELIKKYRTPSPTTKNEAGVTLPDSGKPVTDKQDFDPPAAVQDEPAVPKEPSASDTTTKPVPAEPVPAPAPQPTPTKPPTFWQKHFNKQKILVDLGAIGTVMGGTIAWVMGHHELIGQILYVLAGIIFGGNRMKK